MKPRSFHQFRARPKSVIPAFPCAYTVDYLSSNLAIKEYGRRVAALIFVFTESEGFALVETKKDHDKFGTLLLSRYEKQPAYLKSLIAWSESRKNSLRDFLEKHLPEQSIARLSNEVLIENYIAYCELYRSFHLRNTPPWFIGADAVEREIKRYFNENKLSEDAISSLAEGIEYEPETAAEERGLLQIVTRLTKAGLARIKTIDDLPPVIRTQLRKHIHEFGAIPFGYNSGIVWDEPHYVGRINELLNLGNATQMLKEKKQALKDRKKKQDALVRQLRLPARIIRLFIALRQLAYLQDIKKTAQVRSHPHLWRIVFPEIARRTGIPHDLLIYCSPKEIAYALRNPDRKKELVEQATQRARYSVLIMRDLGYEWLLGQNAREFVRVNKLETETKDVTELRGTAASRGKAKGVVRVCLSSREINKVKAGDILVTAMTTPDFVPAMKRAGAIITDEGGITSHAAIVSRELKKPCIIGTKIATKVLKDSDKVEVDADNGIVRKIK
jgi:phosphohistidine swiveling domain-containing protein